MIDGNYENNELVEEILNIVYKRLKNPKNPKKNQKQTNKKRKKKKIYQNRKQMK